MPPISALRQLRSGQSHPTSCVFAVDEVRFAALCPPSRRPARCTLPADCSRALTLLRVSPPPVFSRGNPPDDLSLASYRCWDGRRSGSSEEEAGEEENVLLSLSSDKSIRPSSCRGDAAEVPDVPDVRDFANAIGMESRRRPRNTEEPCRCWRAARPAETVEEEAISLKEMALKRG